MSEKKPLGLMSVDSFSQLPFIHQRRQVSKNVDTINNGGGIRLFGIEFPPEGSDECGLSPSELSPSSAKTDGEATVEGSAAAAAATQRRFECHYCCRNFPTSQALGGHQNAHKRERQQAKRAHLQTVHMMAHQYHAAGSHVYGVLNHHHHHLYGAPIAPPHLYGVSALPATPYVPLGATGSTVPIAPKSLFLRPRSTMQHIHGCPVSPGPWKMAVEHEVDLSTSFHSLQERGRNNPPTFTNTDASPLPPNSLLPPTIPIEGPQDNNLSLDLHL